MRLAPSARPLPRPPRPASRPRRAAAPPRPASGPPTQSEAELFVASLADDADDNVAPPPPVDPDALEAQAAGLQAKLDATQAALDAAYDATFGDLPYTLDDDDADPRVWPATGGEAAFVSSARGDRAALTALLAAVQARGTFPAFQATVASLKLERGRLAADLEAVTTTLERARAAARAAARRAADAAAAPVPPAVRPLAAPINIVLVTGFEAFNARLYEQACADAAAARPGLSVAVFTDADVLGPRSPALAAALAAADVVFTSLVFDYDQVEWLTARTGGARVRLNFESALELMATTRVGAFTMAPAPGGAKAGPPPAVKKVLSLFGGGREEDRMVGYLSFLKVGPSLLKFVPGDKAADLRRWLTTYAYWNAGGRANVASMLLYLADEVVPAARGEAAGGGGGGGAAAAAAPKTFAETAAAFVASLTAPAPPAPPPPPPPVVTVPSTGLIHPDRPGHIFATPAEYLAFYASCGRAAAAPPDAPRVALLLYRKHVVSDLPYLGHLISLLEGEGIIPLPIFINGVEAHTVVRDVLTTDAELAAGTAPRGAVAVDAVVSTIGFPLVGGPAGTMEGGRQADVARAILTAKDVPYFVAAPLLIQDIAGWTANGVTGLQSVVLYSLPELDGAIDAVPLGGLAAGEIFLVPERVRALARRVRAWVTLRRTPARDRRIAALVYGFPPGVGATGTAALLNVPRSIDAIVSALDGAGYDVGPGAADGSWDGVGQAIIDALTAQAAPALVSRGAAAVEAAGVGDAAAYGAVAVADGVPPARLRDWLSFPASWGPSEWGPLPFLPPRDVLARRLDAQWALGAPSNIAHAASGEAVVSGVALGNLWCGVQPMLGVEGDPLRLLFERDLTPHPQYAAAYLWLQRSFRASALLHVGMHGTVEWLPGAPLGSTGLSWPDVLLGGMPNVYLYAVNNPSESIVAKRRGYGTLVSYNVPPYGRSGLYKQLAGLRVALADWRDAAGGGDWGGDGAAAEAAARADVAALVAAAGLASDVPLPEGAGGGGADLQAAVAALPAPAFAAWAAALTSYLGVLENRLYSSGLHTLGAAPAPDAVASYLDAALGARLPAPALAAVVGGGDQGAAVAAATAAVDDPAHAADAAAAATTAVAIRDGLAQTPGEVAAMLAALDGRYVPAAPGGDLVRDGPGVLPTGRNIHALDPYRMPSAAAAARGAAAADAIVAAHLAAHGGAYPETVAVNLWGLDAIKTKGESVGILIRLVGASVVSDGTGRVARFDLVPLAALGRPRIDVLANVSGIFRDSFANVLDLVDALMESAAAADEPEEQNFIKKHAAAARAAGIDRPTARLFSNPPGDYGSMVGERVGASNWEGGSELGATWAARNAASYGRGGERGTPRPDLLAALLATTDRVVQTVDSVEYGLTDIQEYMANTGALARAAADARAAAGRGPPSGGSAAVTPTSIVEAFGDAPPRDLGAVLKLEYRSKLLNPRWAAAMVDQGSGGAFEISQRMTAMLGWGATVDFKEDWAWDGAVETYVEDAVMADKLKKANPEAFRNIVARALEASGRGLWAADAAKIARLKAAYGEVDDLLEGVK